MEEKQDPSPHPQMSSQQYRTRAALRQGNLFWTSPEHPVKPHGSQEGHWQTHEEGNVQHSSRN